MKRRGHKFWLILALACAAQSVMVIGVAVWLTSPLTPGQFELLLDFVRVRIGPLLVVGLLMLVIFGWGVASVFRNYIRPIRRIVDEIGLIFATNPSHRLNADGGPEIRMLCDRLNEGAVQYESVVNDFEKKVRSARTKSEEEKRILATIMAELPEGVVVCNSEGRILLYNQRARSLLTGSDKAPASARGAEGAARFIGLGRSVFTLFDANLLRHTIDQLRMKVARDDLDVVASFVSPGSNRSLLRIETVPVLDHQRQVSGFILILHDITRQIETGSYLQLSFRSFFRDMQAALAGLRSAIESILEYPDMQPSQLATLQTIIHQQSLNIGDILGRDPTLSARETFRQLPLSRHSVANLVQLLQAKAREHLGVTVVAENIDATVFVKVDSYSLLLALVFILQQINAAHGVTEFDCRLMAQGRFAGLDVSWKGAAITADELRRWERQSLDLKNDGFSLTLRQVVDYHDAEIGAFSSETDDDVFFVRLFLPVVYLSEPFEPRAPTILHQSRPEFYEFDLFKQSQGDPVRENRPLAELRYTVFDLETTGLDPDGGDEIISIGAMRVLNCRLLTDEAFDQLIDPQRSIPWESVKIHGIHPEMLRGKPTIAEVLPKFHRFVGDTVLLGHNAAFDMRFLQLVEQKTGIRFVNPVLDTLLLSAVVHPAHEDHNLEAIAGRLGVSIVARHTASGDALATGEIFIKMLPLLAQSGIRTLREALEASKKSYYARRQF